MVSFPRGKASLKEALVYPAVATAASGDGGSGGDDKNTQMDLREKRAKSGKKAAPGKKVDERGLVTKTSLWESLLIPLP
jgi:hypothetical protein